MKKILFLTSAILTALASFAGPVTLSEATAVAQSVIEVQSTPQLRRAILSEAPSTPAFYIFDGKDGNGFVIVSADDAISPILGYSETGTFPTENLPKNIRHWLSICEEQVRYAQENNIQPDAFVQEEWNQVRRAASVGLRMPQATVIVEPLIQTHWDQGEPYWNLCPVSTRTNEQAYTGCVATAMAQVMNFWQWPKQGKGSHSYTPLDPNTGRKTRQYSTQSANFEETTYDWDNMLDSYISTTGRIAGTAAQKLAVATLMYHCGVSVEMMYGGDSDDGSGAYAISYDGEEEASSEVALVEYFGYKASIKGWSKSYQYGNWTGTSAQWTQLLKDELDAGRPVMYGGSGSGGGHSFVCDGYNSNDYFHFNWGWSGDGDGYFKLTRLNPGSGGIGGGSYSFSQDQDMLIGIEPDYPETEPEEEKKNEEEEPSALTVIPVGAGDYIFDLDGNFDYTVCNIMGQVVAKGKTNSQLSLQQLPLGEYVISVFTPTQLLSAKIMRL